MKTIFLRSLLAWIPLLAACSTVPISQPSPALAPEIPRLDQIAYINQLRSSRPDLIIKDCKPNLIIKELYRKSILQGVESRESIVSNEYTPKLKELDAQWTERHKRKIAEVQDRDRITAQTAGKVHHNQSGLMITRPVLPYQVASYYDPAEYVGYYLGPVQEAINPHELTNPFIHSDGIGFKVFFEFRSFLNDLQPEDFLDFTKALAEAGYQGDLKIPMAPGKMRFYFNNIVLHARTKSDALTAERVGRKFFNSRLTSVGRGVDVDDSEQRNGEGVDWSEFLCARDVSKLPQQALDYVHYRN